MERHPWNLRDLPKLCPDAVGRVRGAKPKAPGPHLLPLTQSCKDIYRSTHLEQGKSKFHSSTTVAREAALHVGW